MRPLRDHHRATLAAGDEGAEVERESIVGGDAALVAALRRCAAGDRSGREELRAWHGGRLRAVLERMLDDRDLTERVLETALDDLYRNAAMIEALGRGPVEDRVFGLLRRHAYAAMRDDRRPPPSVRPSSPVRLEQSPPAPEVRSQAEPSAPTPAPATIRPESRAAPPRPPPPPPLPSEEEETVRPGLTPAGVVVPLEPPPTRARRPMVGDDSDDEWTEADEAAEPPERRRWMPLVLAWLLAAVGGFAVAYLGVTLLAERPSEVVPPPISALAAPSVAVPPASEPSPPIAEPPAPPVTEPAPQDSLGPPLEAPEPSGLAPALAPLPESEPRAAPAEPALQLEDPPTAPLPGEVRVFIHHSAGDAAAASRARALAQRLQERGTRTVIIRQVPFGVRGVSVRYFHDADRAPAARALEVTQQMFGGAAAPSDFTTFQPAPRPGTIEVWLPGGG
jgi:hypothetical protein